MFGTVARLRVVPGGEKLLDAWVRAGSIGAPARGWISTTVYQSTQDPREYWMTVLFEDEESYRRNAEHPNQHRHYQMLRSCLEADPEWHDGLVAWHISGATGKPEVAAGRPA